MTTIKKRWIQSYPHCQQIFPLDLDPTTIRIADIVWALSMKCRFTGHVKHHYSVAQHCVLGARQLPPAFQLPFLLHEVSEAYLPDVSAPVKPSLRVKVGERDCPSCKDRQLGEFLCGFCENGKASILWTWERLEAQHADIILPAIGLGSIRPLIDAPEVKLMDLAMLAAEKEQLLGPEPAEWGLTEPAAKVQIRWWNQVEAASQMLRLFNDLTGRNEIFASPAGHP